jgi:hypothetical protein
MTWLIGVPYSMISGIVAPYATLRQAPVPRTAGDSTMVYDALRTIMPIAGWPEERAREVQISVSGTLGPRFAHDSPLEEAGFELVWGFFCQVVIFGL